MQQADSVGAVPMFTLFLFSADNLSDMTSLGSASYMQAYWSDTITLFKAINAFGKPVLINVEPDFWGFAQAVVNSNYGGDPTKVAIKGWSIGGWQTQMCRYTAPDTFTLGIAGAGPTEWQNYNTWYTGGVIGNSPKGDPAYLDKYSLTHLAKNLKSPLMLLHGVEDTNVLFQDTIKVYRELLQFGKGQFVELAIDPTGSHGMGGDMNNRDRHAIYLTFILKHWGLPAAHK